MLRLLFFPEKADDGVVVASSDSSGYLALVDDILCLGDALVVLLSLAVRLCPFSFFPAFERNVLTIVIIVNWCLFIQL